MVDLTERVAEIRKLVDAGKYFTINRARQYGKTTTLAALQRILVPDYVVISISFEGISEAGFASEASFAKSFCKLLLRECRYGLVLPENVSAKIDQILSNDADSVTLVDLFDILLDWCEAASKKIVLFIDEVDAATNNQVFLDFLAMLRDGYIQRDTKGLVTLHSVILAGVTDVRHLKMKLRPEGEHKENSPWNVATPFNLDMSLPESGIQKMLEEYEADYHTGMNTISIAKQIREYTCGYPFLVSRICQMLDKEMVPRVFKSLSDAWTTYGVDEAVKTLLQEDNMLFQSLMGKLVNFPELKGNLRRILMRGDVVPWLPYDEEQKQLAMYGFICNNHNTVAISNRIFEMLLYVHFVGESEKNEDLKQLSAANKSIFVTEDGWLDVRKIMEHFIIEHNRIHGNDSGEFLEAEGRERFLTYLAPIINGTGTYSIEEQTRTHRRMDVVIHYLGKRYVIELKIWRGERYNADGEKQISDYLDYFDLSTGYMLSFNFNQKKESGVKRVQIGDKVLFEGTV